ncbi:MAG: hypothetical protein KGR26_03135, partial [Cyanobacteria bacterium REEB65]|nr:hypothetical protein [Cyanobacteria bacterium REEB65]
MVTTSARHSAGRMGRQSFVALLLTVFLAACSALRPPTSGTSSGAPSIVGSVDFGTEQVQANIGDIANGATVSLIDTVSNSTVASTITQPNGSFTLSFSGWSPTANEVYYLEAVRGLDNNTAGNDAARLRTLIGYSASTWQSITQSVVNINQYTTALS